MPSSDTKGKSRATNGAAHSDERSPLLGKRSTNSPGAIRHGRGLLSEDDDGSSSGGGGEDDDVDSEEAAHLGTGSRGRHSSRSRVPFLRHTSYRALFCYFILVLIGLAFLAFAIIHVWLGRFVSEQFKDDAAVIRARAPDSLIWEGPDSVKVLSVTKDEVTVQIDGRAA